jgi:nucleoside-diphosphate-sugar epimerase
VTADGGLAPRAEAVQVLRATVPPEARVLVTGASGWFGRTCIALLEAAFGRRWVDEHVLAVGSRSGTIDVLGVGPVAVVPYHLTVIAGFRPTVVVNCAFPTRDRVATLGVDEYVATARELTTRLLAVAAMPSVGHLVTYSSGAAVPSPRFPADLRQNPYGVLKAEEERAVLEVGAAGGPQVHVMRVWAVSGMHVQRPGAYAFSQFVLDALRGGPIVVQARHPVLRSYALVDDVIADSFDAMVHGVDHSDSGGEAIEIGQLAAIIGTSSGGVAVRRSHLAASLEPDVYCSPAAREPGRRPAWVPHAGVREQARRVLAAARLGWLAE